VMQQKVDRVRGDLMATLVSKCRATQAKAYLPSAGPACFLDPALARFNDRDRTIFPTWDKVQAAFSAACPDVKVVPIRPGDSLRSGGGALARKEFEGQRPSDDLAEYSRRRAAEWGEFHAAPDRPIGEEEIGSYFARLQRRNRHLTRDFSKRIQLVADGK